MAPDLSSLAEAIYDARAFNRLPELADALEQAGCRDTEILAHLRSPGPHVRGWRRPADEGAAFFQDGLTNACKAGAAPAAV